MKVERSASRGAVFLSYASQDVAAALRICAALRAAGVEVWFDQDALVGGDAWDAKIRGQVKTCALFVPVISANTNGRTEGYFRLEWHLAEQRMLLIAHDQPFLVPVVIDETTDAAARVPDRFRERQWTRLPGGETSSAFCARVRQMLGLDQGVARAFQSVGSDDTGWKPRGTPEVSRRVPAAAWGVAGAVAAVALAVGGYFWVKRPTPEPAPISAQPAGAGTRPPTSEKPSLDPRRIAVMPLDNFSPDTKDEYLAGSLTAELNSCLAKISGLEVIARSSAERAKESKRSVPEIGTVLGVGTLLEGSVTKAGEQLRISVQLIDVATQRQLWSKDYDTEFKNIFQMQRDVAERVAAALKITLLGAAVQRLKTEPTASPAAYQLYLKGRFHQSKWTEAGALKAREYFDQAVMIDPNYALAYCGISETTDPKAAPLAIWREAENAARRALELDDSLPEAHYAMANVKYWFEWNWTGAERAFKRAIALNPSLGDAHVTYARFLMGMSRFEEAIAEMKIAVELDPASAGTMTDLAMVYHFARKYEQAIGFARKALELDSNFYSAHVFIGWALVMQGKLAEALPVLQQVATLERTPHSIWHIACRDALAGRHDEARRAIAELDEWAKSRYVPAKLPAALHLLLGEKERALTLLEKCYADRDSSCAWLKVDPLWDALRSEPRFQVLVEKMAFDR